MKIKLRSKFIIALTSLFIVPILIVVSAVIMIRFNYIKIPVLQNVDLSSINIVAEGKDPKDLLVIPFTLFGIFVVSLSGMVLIISKVLSDFVLKPLKELIYASEEIGSGNLDFKIKYSKDNEFGKLCREFDTMKTNLVTANRKQQIYENSRKELIASITHDLKTPLTSIIGYVEGLQDGVVTNTDTVKDYLNVIHDKSMRLDHLIDDLFTFTQLELEKFTVDIYNISMFQVLTEYTNTKMREFSSKDTALEFIVEQPIHDAVIPVDEFRIGQILENLINNAEKYASTYIKIFTEVSDEFYSIYVEDDGIGISQEDLPHIFEYFYKCDKARESIKKGSGLGLAICKQLVDAHKGKIFASSKLGKGTIFKICLRR